MLTERYITNTTNTSAIKGTDLFSRGVCENSFMVIIHVLGYLLG